MKPWRLRLMLAMFFLLSAVIIGRLFFVQVTEHKRYGALALGQQTVFKDVRGERGEIFFQNSKESRGREGSAEVKSLAINKEKWLAYAVSASLADKSAFAEALAAPLGLSNQSIAKSLDESDSYVVLKKNLTQEQLQALKAMNLEGLRFESSTARYYPQGQLGSQVVGFLGGDGAGQYGLEGYYEQTLAGKEGIRQERRGLEFLNVASVNEPLDGKNLYLTIDYNLQFQAESLLKEANDNIGIASGQIIVLKPDSGRVLALANYPNFNPNNYAEESGFEIFQNSTSQKIFEPGSIFKPFTMAMALNEGRVVPEDTFVDTGFVKIGSDTIFNFNREKYDRRTMSEILEKSINTGAVFLGKMLSNQTFFEYLRRFRFLDKTGIDLQGEVYSKNETLKKSSDFVYATASFGQGIELTPIQLAAAFAMFANGGKIIQPHVVDKIVSDEKVVYVQPKSLTPVISEKTASQVSSMLINVVERGFGDLAKIKGYYLAGKTGTAQVPYENKKGYYPDKTIQSFIGFGPALKPEFLILVKLDNPKVPQSSLSAAPVFRKMAQYIINYWQIPPDY